MADLTYSASLQDGISPGLKKIQSELKTTQDLFSKFQNAIAGIAIGGFIVNAVRMAAALDDVATASGMALQTVIGFGQAVAANGGSVEGANQAISKFAKYISSAAEGNREAQQTFQKLGISLDDLGTLSEQDLMRKTIQGLSQTNDNALRTAKGMEIFGKSFNTVDFKGVNAGLDGFIQRAGPAAAAVKAAADAEQNFATAMNTFQISLLAALEPLSKFFAALDPQAINTFVSTLVELGKIVGLVAGTFGLFKYVIAPLGVLRGELAALSVQGWTLKEVLGAVFGGLGGPLKSMGNDISSIGDAFKTTAASGMAGATALERVGIAIAGILGVGARLLGWVGVLYTAFEALDFALRKAFSFDLSGWLDGVAAKAAKILGISYKTEEAKRDEAAATKKAAEEQQKQTAAAEKTRAVVDTIGIAYRGLVADLQKGVDAYMRGNAEVLKRLQLESELIGLTDQQRAVKQALFDVESKNSAELTRLQELYKEKSKSSKEEDLRLLPDIVKAMDQVKASLQGQKTAVEDLIVANAARVEQENQLKALADFSGATQINNAKTLRDLQHEMATSTMGAIEKKYADIARAADESARAEIDKENSRRRQLGLIAMTADEEAKYYAASKRGLAEIGAAHKKSYEQSRTWSSGWNKAWREYADDATNAAKTAENIFKKTTSGIEDAIVGLVKTGKFEWKSLLGSIAEEMLRSGIRKSMVSMFEGLSSGDGILGSLGKMFGLEGVMGGGGGQGASANNPLYVYDIAGGGGGGGARAMSGGGQSSGGQSSGGSWWDTITEGVTGVWDSVTSGLGNVWDTVSGGITSIFGDSGGAGGGGDWLSGITDLFGGFFANGGTLGAGKWGIAGENGPEMISGPATIAPLGGSTSVTYNINAVDAASFKSMIAADPGFIHAVAQQGGRNVPRRY